MSLFLNGFMVLLCIAAIFYCRMLAKHMVLLRDRRHGLGAAIDEMIDATRKMQNSFESGRHNVSHHTDRMQDKIMEGTVLVECLEDAVRRASQILEELRVQQAHIKDEKYLDNSEVSTDKIKDDDPLADVVPQGLFFSERMRNAPARAFRESL